MGSYVCLGVFLLVLIICIAGMIKSRKEYKVIQKQWQDDQAKGIKRFSAIDHVGGLNAVENSGCEVVLSPSSLMITCAGKQYTLPIGRIKYVDFKVDVDEKLYQKNSFVKGVAGAAMFGVSGAVIGSAPKTKVRRDTKGYAVIGYKDARGTEKIILLRDNAPNSGRCSALVDALRTCVHTQIEKIEL